MKRLFPVCRAFTAVEVPLQVNCCAAEQGQQGGEPLTLQDGGSSLLITAQLGQRRQQINNERTQTHMRTLLAQSEEIHERGFNRPQDDGVAAFKVKRNGEREEQQRQGNKRLTQDIQTLLPFQHQRGKSVNGGEAQRGECVRRRPVFHHAVLQSERRRHRAEQ